VLVGALVWFGDVNGSVQHFGDLPIA